MKKITLLSLDKIQEAIRPMVEQDGYKLTGIEWNYTWSDTPVMGDYKYCNGIKAILEKQEDEE